MIFLSWSLKGISFSAARRQLMMAFSLSGIALNSKNKSLGIAGFLSIDADADHPLLAKADSQSAQIIFNDVDMINRMSKYF
jgi:hypothetical protein